MPQIAKVAVAAATYAIDKPYDYLIPQGTDIAVGMRVLAPFGRGNRVSEGVVLALGQGVPDKPIKPIRSVVDREPVITDREIRLALWMRERYFCTFYDAIRTILPAAVWYSYREMWSLTGEPLPEDLSEREAAACRLLQDGPMERDDLCAALGETGSRVLSVLKKRGLVQMEPQGSRKVQDRVVQIACLALEPEEALERMERKKKSAARQYDAVAFLAKYGDAVVQELCYYTGVSRQGIRSLERAGLVSLRSQEEYRISRRDYDAAAEEITLNDEQQRAYDEILAQCRDGRPGVTLLQGVTGSGKTLVYIRLAQTLLAEGRSVMILVPEIALTPQMMARFSAYFGDQVALLHSGLRLTERYDQWKRIRRGEAHIVLGTRSAVFAPLENLGLIILDEEQESSYESENPPCYHARDIAKYRCFRENARLLLGSATPTVETAYYARRGDYQLALLRRRYNAHRMPRVILADMRRELRDGNAGCISRELARELEKNLEAGEQSILFLNRRGSSRELLCPQCGYVPQCPRCSVYLTYHSANGRMMCHYCGYSEKSSETCPSCGGAMKHIGFGTQKVEEELTRLSLFDPTWYGTYPNDGSILYYGMAPWHLGQSNVMNPDGDLFLVPFPKMPGSDKYYLCGNAAAKMLVKNSDKGDAVAAYIKCERLAATQAEYKQAAKEKALIETKTAAGKVTSYLTEEQYDFMQTWYSSEDIVPMFDFGYGMGTRMSNETYAYETRGVMNNFMDGLLQKYEGTPGTWAEMRSAWQGVVDEVVDEFNAKQ